MHLLFLGLLVPFLTLPALLLMERLERWTTVTMPARSARQRPALRAELRESQPREGASVTPAVARVGTRVMS
jgi:hypothetical protein